MDTRQKDIEKLKEYKYGFTTDIENIKAPKGLNEDVIKFISKIKKEPNWMLDFRLKAFEISKIAFQQKRKKIRSSLSSILNEDQLIKLNLDANLRASDLSPEDYLLIAEESN